MDGVLIVCKRRALDLLQVKFLHVLVLRRFDDIIDLSTMAPLEYIFLLLEYEYFNLICTEESGSSSPR